MELKDLVDDNPKRSLPDHTQNDSPESRANKKSKPLGDSGPSSPSIIPSSTPPIIPSISSITPSSASVIPLVKPAVEDERIAFAIVQVEVHYLDIRIVFIALLLWSMQL
jgi:hypothetical protein